MPDHSHAWENDPVDGASEVGGGPHVGDEGGGQPGEFVDSAAEPEEKVKVPWPTRPPA